MHTMYRCFSLILLAALSVAPPAWAQFQRAFPANALRGALVVSPTAEISMNGQPASLAPGARIRNPANMMEPTGALAGQRLLVHYTLDMNGAVKEVWVLRPEEAAVTPWPTTAAQAQSWVFNADSQTWLKP
jgi:hypothetical protein